MFVLDTNVLSAMMSAEPVQKVAAWVLGQASEDLFTQPFARRKSSPASP